ncbi:MAG: Gfo/Idh/MocA family oxidoreductase [Pirellulaceae bacterium]|nr:Gfo/Idh/MocA family oxidoreductase [Pirellulaceae bacterium]
MTLENPVPSVVPSSPDTRRNFIKATSAIVAGGTLVGGQLPLARAAHAFGSDVIKLGLIGCGGRGTGAVGQAMDTEGPTRLVAAADAFESRSSPSLAGLKKKYPKQVDPNIKIHNGLEAYKEVLASDCDLVILATPPGFRPLHFEAAIKAGKNVFAEKPVASDAPGVRRFLEANKLAKEKGLTVQVGLQRHHQTDYRETIAKLKDGAIGDILYTRVYWNGAGVWIRDRKPEQTELEYQVSNWYYFNWLSGDHICEQHIHNLDVSNWLMDAHPIEVNGQGGRQVRTGDDTGEIYDHHFLEYTYPNGAKMFSQCRHIPGCWGDVSEFAHGTKGWCEISKGIIYDHNNKEVWKSPKDENGHANEHVDLFAAIRKGEIPNEGDYGATSTMTAIMGRMASYSGKKLSWDDCFNSKVALADFDSLHSYQDNAPVQPENGKYWIPMPGGDTSKIL